MKNLTSQQLQNILIAVILFASFLATISFRPLLPIDETRYMSVAWEMYLRQDWLAPLTVNFSPYHHKPPLLFWLINSSWSIFGVSRWAGTIPILIATILYVYLTKLLAIKLFPNHKEQAQKVPFLIMGSIPFLIYSNFIMFDIMLSVFVLLSLIILISYAENKKIILLPLLALAIGLGILTKGPVMWLYIIFPMIFGPLWIENSMPKLKWYFSCLITIILSTIPILLWLIPVLSASSNDFAFWLIWEQTAGRITGNFSSSHARPLYFYIMFIPIMLAPWIFFPSFWSGFKTIKNKINQEAGLRFILIWIIPVFISFSLISGKQPHYMVPLIPGIIILIAITTNIAKKKIIITTLSLVSFIIIGQAIASQTFFKNYDLRPVVNYINSNPDKDLTFVKKYHGEFTFLGRLEKPLDVIHLDQMDKWFEEHPNGLAITRYYEHDPVHDYDKVFNMPYRGKHMGIFQRAEDK